MEGYFGPQRVSLKATVANASFVIATHSWVAKAYLPVVHGRMEPIASGALIRLRCRPRLLELCGIPLLWLWAVAREDELVVSLILLALPAVYHVLGCLFGLHPASRAIEAHLARHLNATRLGNHVGDSAP